MTESVRSGQLVDSRLCSYLDTDYGACRLTDLFQNVAVTARSLVVNRADDVFFAELDARPNNPVHLLLHLGVATLHRVEVKTRIPSRIALWARHIERKNPGHSI
jgi:hypothetical protein